MTSQPKSTIKTYFITGAKPTQAQFADLVDSYQDNSALLNNFVSAAAFTKGIPNVTSSTIVTMVSAGVLGLQVLAAETSAQLSDLTNSKIPANSVSVNATTSASVPAGLALAASTILGRDSTNNASALALADGLTAIAGVLSGNITTGTWTPIDSSGASLVFTLAFGNYMRIGTGSGSIIIATGQCTYPATANGANAKIGGLPFTGGGNGKNGGTLTYTSSTAAFILLNDGTSTPGTTFNFYTSVGANVINSAMGNTTNYFQIIYQI